MLQGIGWASRISHPRADGILYRVYRLAKTSDDSFFLSFYGGQIPFCRQEGFELELYVMVQVVSMLRN